MSKIEEYTEDDAVQAFQCAVDGLHGCHAKYTPRSKAAFIMWLHAIKKKKLEKKHARQIDNKS